MILSIFVFCLLVMQTSLTPLVNNDNLDYDSLYYDVVNEQYNSAVRKTTDLYLNGKGNIIKLVVRRLLAESRRSLFDYAYKVFNNGLGLIVHSCFPRQFQWILSGERLAFINLRDNMALKAEWNTDRDGDRGAYGDNNEWNQPRMAWKGKGHWFNNRAYFQIMNAGYSHFLKLERSSDNVGEHKAFIGAEHDTWRHNWYFQPTIYNGELVFFIINRQYDQALKLGRDTDGDNDRRAWGHNGYVSNNPAHYAWHIQIHKE